MPIGVYKRKPFTAEHRKNMSDIQKIAQNRPEVKKKCSESHKRKHPSKKTRKAMKIAANRPEVKKAKSEAHRGSKNHFWKGGITPLKWRIRNCYLFKQWTKDVFTRDNFECQGPGPHKGCLCAHHIKKIDEIISEYNLETIEEVFNCPELWNTDNGLTWCRACHAKHHNKK